MYQAHVQVRGTTAFLFNRYTDKPRSGALRREELIAEGMKRVYRDDDQALVWPRWNILRGLMDGARLAKVKMGKASIVPYLQALVTVEADGRFNRTDFDGLDEHMGRIPPRTGPMVLLYRPKLDAGWTLDYTLLVLNSDIGPDTLQQIVGASGLLAGMGAWRPHYGRYLLNTFTTTALDDGIAAPLEKTTTRKRRSA